VNEGIRNEAAGAPGTFQAPDLSWTESLARALTGRYTIERELGRGGSALVYLARDLVNDRLVAFKVLRPELLAAIAVPRFIREIEIEGRLTHTHILPIYESGSVDGRPYYTMPYVEGETLRDRLRREKHLRTDDVLSIATAVASALEYAHAQGVVHRDVKPANILLASDGQLFLADFGIARAMTMASGDQITDSGMIIGTPEYMSPEQATGGQLLNARSDVYALGCVIYEMLAGEPPFTGPTPQAIIARHCYEPPRSMRVVRPSLRPGVQVVVERALAKVPADRFETPTEMVNALARELAATGTRWTVRPRLVAASVLGLMGLATATYVALHRSVDLDANRIVVFPLRDTPGIAGPGGEEVATYIGYALEDTRPLNWLEGWELMDARERGNVGALTAQRASAVSRSARAAFFVDGSIVRAAESTTVVLRLHSVAGDSVVARAGASGTGSLPSVGLRAMAVLLPALLAPGRHVDLSTYEQRNPTAVANFLQGEREYRRMHFDEAIAHYHDALREDSSLAIAALRGAEAANWRARYGEDTAFASQALRRVQSLPSVRALVARGMYAYLTGATDVSLRNLRQALAIDSSSADVWTLLGEVYLRMLPASAPADTAARSALERARRIDRGFAPALALLEEIALREGRVDDVVALNDELRLAGADTTHAVQRDIMLRCVRNGPSAVDWPAVVRKEPRAVLAAGKVLSGGGAQAACARSAFTAALTTEGASLNPRWGALLGLQGVLVLTGNESQIPALLASPATDGLPTWVPLVLDVTAGVSVENEASAAVERRGTNYAAMSTTNLYIMALWYSHRHDGERLRLVAHEMHRKADSSRTRRDSLLVRAVDARVPLMTGDTLESLRQLRALLPSAPRTEIAWQPFEALGAERLLQAQLLNATGRFDDAIRVANTLDAIEPISYLVYLRSSLSLRAVAARNAGRNAEATAMERRLEKLQVQARDVTARQH
jgi:tetratricopeptide (TPR) repeat protein